MDYVGAVIVTGASRRIGIGSEIVRQLAANGWNVFATWWTPYDASMPWGSTADEVDDLLAVPGVVGMQADLADPDAPAALFDVAVAAVGPIRALVNVHTYDPGGGLETIDAAGLDRHLAINVRGTYLLCREFSSRYTPTSGPGRIVNFLSGPPLVGSVAYATSKGAVHWITLSIAGELAARGITVNAINPGPTDTGWMSAELRSRLAKSNPIGRVSEPHDAANIVRFLCRTMAVGSPHSSCNPTVDSLSWRLPRRSVGTAAASIHHPNTGGTGQSAIPIP